MFNVCFCAFCIRLTCGLFSPFPALPFSRVHAVPIPPAFLSRPLFCVLRRFSCLVVCLYCLCYRGLYGVYLRSIGFWLYRHGQARSTDNKPCLYIVVTTTCIHYILIYYILILYVVVVRICNHKMYTVK